MIPVLPETLAPPAPFPLVTSQSLDAEFVAPGVRRGTYALQTPDGPLVVTVVAIDTREPTVRIGAVVANDRMVSAGETVSSMAQRTSAIAGVNADYFDIGQTNQPLNLVVHGGALLRTPSKRIVFDVHADRSISFDYVSFSGSVAYGQTTIPLTGVNEWPPQGGISVLTPAYGEPKAYPGVTLAQLVPIDEAHVATDVAGAYRIAGLGTQGVPARGTIDLGFGPAARAAGVLPNVGDDVTIAVATQPALGGIAEAVGGGPLLVQNGAPVADPNAPAPEETERRFPVSGAALARDGELLFVAVDGRRPSLSIGLTRPQFASLMLGFGATSAMAFDSGGSATLVARVLGEANARVLNAPSDGEERPVADGVFVYSDAPQGPAAQLVVRPSRIVALPDTDVRVALALVDAAGHPVTAADALAPQAVRAGAASRVAIVRHGSLVTNVPVDVVPHLARLDVSPAERDPDPGAMVAFLATGFDARGRAVSLGERVRWSSDRGRFARPGLFIAPAHDARIVASAGGARGEWTLRVGRHREPLDLFGAAARGAWRFDAAPAGADGAVAFAANRPEMSLRYDFTANERAAYADADVALPGEPQSFTIDVLGDAAAGVGVRAAFVNTFGERRALTLARAVDWSGWRTVTIAIPDDLNLPVRLVALYAVDSLANAPSRAAGSLSFRNASVVDAGTP